MISDRRQDWDATEIPVTDVEKLHAESLQIRSQQFLIGTLAMTGSGLALGFSTGLTNNSNISSWVMLVILISWLTVLSFLFYWSLALKSLVMVISEYLKISTVQGKPATHWEGWYFSLSAGPEKKQNSGESHKKNSPRSQTTLIQNAFFAYGAVAAVINIASYTLVGSSSKNDISSEFFSAIVLLIFIVYLVFMLKVKQHFKQEDYKLKQRILNTPWDAS